MVALSFKLLLLLLFFGANEGSIRRIRFKGNEHFSASKLRNTIQIQRKDIYSDEIVRLDSFELTRFYTNQGFPWAEVSPVYTAYKGRLIFYINEGRPLVVRSIKIVGASATDANLVLARSPLKKGSRLTLFGLQETGRITKRYYQDKGYPFAGVEVDTATIDSSEDKTAISLILRIDPGPRAWISSVSFIGLPPTNTPAGVRESFLLRTTRLKKGDLYSIAKIDRASRLLYSTSLFSDVNMSLATLSPERNDSLEILFELKPSKVRVILLGAGLQTGRDSLIPDRLLLSLGWEHLNLFHQGVTFSSEVTFVPTLRGDYEMNVELSNSYPNFLPWGLTLSISPYWKNQLKRDTVNIFTNTLGGEAGLERDFSEQLRIGLSAQVKKVWQTPKGLPYDETGSTNFLRLSLIYDNRNDFFNPTSGLFFYPYADWAGNPFGGNNHFARLSAELRNYLSLPFNAVLAWRLRGGIMISHSGMNLEDISNWEKFTLGGSGTVRAVKDGSLGPDSVVYTRITTDTVAGMVLVDTSTTVERYGTLMALHNLEIRTPYMIKDIVGFVLFVDIGVCMRDLNSTPVANRDLAWGPGVGIRIKTPIGPVRIDYAKNPNTPFSFNPEKGDPGRIELGFLQAF